MAKKRGILGKHGCTNKLRLLFNTSFIAELWSLVCFVRHVCMQSLELITFEILLFYKINFVFRVLFLSVFSAKILARKLLTFNSQL